MAHLVQIDGLLDVATLHIRVVKCQPNVLSQGMYSRKLPERKRRCCPCNLKWCLRVLPLFVQTCQVDGATCAVKPQLGVGFAPYSRLHWGKKCLTTAICDCVDGAIALAFRSMVDGTSREVAPTFTPKQVQVSASGVLPGSRAAQQLL